MKFNRSVSGLVAAAAVAVFALGVSGAAQANDVFWSVGVASPGVSVGVANAPPVFVQQPVYVQQPYGQPYQQPYAAYVQPRPVYVQPQPYYAQAAPVYVQYPGWGYQNRGWHNGYGRNGQERFEHGRNEHGNGHGNGHGHRD